jgi:hypothetical protein
MIRGAISAPTANPIAATNNQKHLAAEKQDCCAYQKADCWDRQVDHDLPPFLI